MSNSHAERKPVRFIVTSEVEIDYGMVLEPGIYEGRSTHLGYIKHEEYFWTPKRYFLEMNAEEITFMGGKVPGHATLVEYDITKNVEDGSIRIK